MQEKPKCVHLSIKLRELSDEDARQLGLIWQDQWDGGLELEFLPLETQPLRATDVAGRSDGHDR